MSAPRILAVIVAAGLLLTGCAAAPVATPSPTPTATRTPTPTPIAEEPKESAIVLSLDSLTVVDQEGGTVQTVPFTDPNGVLALVTEITGTAAPVVQDVSPKGFMSHQWDGIYVSAYAMNAFVVVNAAEVGGLPVRTADGIHVGSTRAEVMALAPFEGYDSDGDGLSDTLGLEQRPGPGNESLHYPGQPGTEFIGVRMTGDAATLLRAPDSDYGDI